MYTGKTYRLPLKGGWDANPDYDVVDNTDFIEIDNINLHNGAIQPRGGCEKKGTLPNTYNNVNLITPNGTTTFGYSAISDNGTIIAISLSAGGTTGTIFRSPDGGDTWASIIISSTIGALVCSGAFYGNSNFVILFPNYIIYSTDDGLTWATVNIGTFTAVSGVYAESKYVIVSTSGIRYSTDLLTWVAVSTANCNSVAWGGGVFIAVGWLSTNVYISRSLDGITWATTTYSTSAVISDPNSCTYGNGIFIIVGTFDFRIMYSTDLGVSWTTKILALPTPGISGDGWRYITYGDGTFVLLGINDDGYLLIATSIDGYTWDIDETTYSFSCGNLQYGGNIFACFNYAGYNALKISIGKNNIEGISQFLRLNGEINGAYLIDENDNYIVDELGNYIVSEGADMIACMENGSVYQNYNTLIKTLKYDEICFFENFLSKLYISNGKDMPIVWDGSLGYAIDMGCPSKPTVALVTVTGGLVTAGDHYYAITYVTASGESTIGSVSDAVTNTTACSETQLTNIPIGDDGTTSRKIYRTAANSSTFKFLATLSDNTTTSYLDNIADASLGDEPETKNLAFLPTDWYESYPKYFLAHGRGTSKRLWAYGVPSYPSRLYASLNNLADFSDTNVTIINILTDKITACVEYGGNLIVFSKDQAYIVDDTSDDTTGWGVTKAIWSGGAASQRLVCKTPNDVIVMAPEGNVYSISTTQKYGDFEIGSITKPKYINTWVQENVDLAKLDNFFMMYDSNIRAIKIFVVLNGNTYPTACLVYFIDKGTWSKHTYAINLTIGNFIRESESQQSIYIGDDNGNILKLESDLLTDDGEIYESSFTTSPISFEDIRSEKIYDKLWAVLKAKGTETLTFEIYIDGRSLGSQTLTMAAAQDLIKNYCLYIGATGQRIQIKFTSSDGKDYFLSQFLFDHDNLGGA